MVELLAGVDSRKGLRPKLRALDQRFALVRTTRAIDDLRLYRILLTTSSCGSKLADFAPDLGSPRAKV
jgi:hypothetical protein